LYKHANFNPNQFALKADAYMAATIAARDFSTTSNVLVLDI